LCENAVATYRWGWRLRLHLAAAEIRSFRMSPEFTMRSSSLDRRQFVIGAAVTLVCPITAHAAFPSAGRLRFIVLRNGVKVGEHMMTFGREGPIMRVTSEVAMSIRLAGLVDVRYAHEAHETWNSAGFQTLETSTTTNSKREQVSARRTAAGVEIQTQKGRLVAGAGCSPLTHWNTQAFGGPLFNPQTGKVLKVSARRGAAGEPPGGALASSRWEVRGGETQIEDWYDAAGVWTALRGRLPDRSTMEYHPV
jgi:hypothetical protein